MDEDLGTRGFTEEQLLVTAEAAARLLGVGRTTLYALIRDGRLHSVHIGRSCRVTRAELRRFVARLDAAAVPTSLASKRSPRRPTAGDGLFDLEPIPPHAA
jgi:excisionase family DNA binding protein